MRRSALEVQTVSLGVRNLAPALEGARLFALSDLHVRGPAPAFDEAVRAARAAKPLCVALLGDLIDLGTPDVSLCEPVLRALREVAPVVAVNGNNDAIPEMLPALRALYGACGATLLEDAMFEVRAGGAALRFLGLQDPEVYATGLHPLDESPERREQRLGGMFSARGQEDGGVSVLLLHRPERAKAFLHLRPALVLCGHAHGGQIRLFGQGLFSPGQGFFPRYTSGLYRLGDAHMAVCRGLGNHAFVPRIFNPPHALLIKITRK